MLRAYLLPALHSKFTSGGTQGSYGGSRDWTRSSICKESTHSGSMAYQFYVSEIWNLLEMFFDIINLAPTQKTPVAEGKGDAENRALCGWPWAQHLWHCDRAATFKEVQRTASLVCVSPIVELFADNATTMSVCENLVLACTFSFSVYQSHAHFMVALTETLIFSLGSPFLFYMFLSPT